MAGILKVDKYQDFNGNDIMTSDGAGNITLSSNMTTAVQAVGSANTPAFFAQKNATQSPGNNAFTKITYETEVLDTNNAFASSTFTVPSGKAGVYFIGFNKMNNKGGLTVEDYTSIYKNGSSFAGFTSFSGNQTQLRNHNIIMDLAVGDYVEIYHYGTTSDSSSASLLSGERNSFYGYKIIGA